MESDHFYCGQGWKDGQNKHQGRLRLSTMISLVHTILESRVTMPEILAESDQVHVFI